MAVEPQRYTRRASYGPSSPVVGTRGTRTRQQIVGAALHCFTEKGVHATAVEGIASRAETSRATLYQYFESKEAIFVELLNESGAALLRVTRRLGPLGPTAEGFDNLHWWLGEWSWVFDRYAAMFIEWANINSPKAPLRVRLSRFVEGHTDLFGNALTTAGFRGTDPATMSILALAVIDRFNYIRHVYRPGLSESQMLDDLAVALQLALFPDTPKTVLEAGPESLDRSERSPGGPPPLRAFGALETLPPRTTVATPMPFEELSEQAARTVRQLLDAAGRVFADAGYAAANVDQIVTEAALARGTFYRYFRSKLELMTALADDCARDLREPFCALGRFGDHPDPVELRRWLYGFLGLHERYTGVLRAWTEGLPADPAVLAARRDVLVDVGAAIDELFGPRGTYALDRRAVGMMMAGLLEHFPNEGKGTRYEPSAAQVVEAQALFIERVLLDR